jgi:N-methylhydantoinase B
MDPIVLNVLWNRLISTVNEQAAALMRSSFSSIVREAGDLAAGVFDRRGRMVAQATTGTPGHINPMATCMHHFLARFPIDELAPGDVLITNVPWKTASQLNDITIATPVFKRGRAIALFANCCHALDIGGRGLSADSLSVFEEGIFIPVMKLYDKGSVVAPLMEMIEANVRTPDEVVGDIHSQMIANAVGARQLAAFLDEFDLDDIEALSDEIIDRSERAMRERIKAVPDGAYPSEMTIDGYDEPIVIKAKLIVEGDQLTVDFTGTSATVGRGINVALNYTRGYTTYGIKCAISPDVPNNAGSFRPVQVTAPEGCILNAPYPVAVAGRHLVGHFLPSAVMGALAGALSDKVIAPGADALWDTHIAGEGPDGRYFSFTWFSCGGTGALARKDGLSATAFPSGIAGVPVEVIETLSPVVVTPARAPPRLRWRRHLPRQSRPDHGIRRAHREAVSVRRALRADRLPAAAARWRRAGRGGSPARQQRSAAPRQGNYHATAGYRDYDRDPGWRRLRLAAGTRPRARARRCPRGLRHGRGRAQRYGVVVDSTSWVVDEAATNELRARRRLGRRQSF